MSRQVKIRPRSRPRSATFFCVIAALCAPAPLLADDAPPDVLTNAAQVLALSAEKASNHIPVVVRGVVTAAEPTWQGEFFVQDATSGVYVANRSGEPPEPGDLVEVTGVSQSGFFAANILRQSWTKVGTAPLPKPRRVPLEQLMSGLEDGQRVEVAGVVRAVVPNKVNMDVELA